MTPKTKILMSRYMGPEAQQILDDDQTLDVNSFLKFCGSYYS